MLGIGYGKRSRMSRKIDAGFVIPQFRGTKVVDFIFPGRSSVNTVGVYGGFMPSIRHQAGRFETRPYMARITVKSQNIAD
jgi:hypothetical protein